MTVKRNNKLIDALSVPRMALYNVRSAWSKWDNMEEDVDNRQKNFFLVSFYTDVWQKIENKKHQKAIETILQTGKPVRGKLAETRVDTANLYRRRAPSQQSADWLAVFFSAMSQSVEPLHWVKTSFNQLSKRL